MKKLIITLTVALAACLSANAQFFWGMQFGVYTDGNVTTYSGIDEVEKGGTSFNYSLKPSIGYYFTPKLVGGVRFVYSSNSFANGDTSKKSTTIWNYALNLLMGNGLDSNCMKYQIDPYIRYNFASVFNDKLKIWAELNGYVGGKYSLDSETHKIVDGSGNMTYGVLLHPMVSLDLADKWMLFSSVDAFSIGWDGTMKKSVKYLDNSGEPTTVKTYSGSFLCQFNPVIAIARCFTTIGVIKKF